MSGCNQAVSKYPAPTREHHDAFCQNEGWQLVRGAKGQPVTHHRTYELPLENGQILRTRISKPVNGSTYGKDVWAHVLREQLCVSAQEFWECVQNDARPARGEPVNTVETLPLYLINILIKEVGLEPTEAGSLSLTEAQGLIKKFWEQEAEK